MDGLPKTVIPSYPSLAIGHKEFIEDRDKDLGIRLGERLKAHHVLDAFTDQAGFDLNEGLLPLVGRQRAEFTPQFL